MQWLKVAGAHKVSHVSLMSCLVCWVMVALGDALSSVTNNSGTMSDTR